MTFSHLWNELPEDLRLKLKPYSIEVQIRHIEMIRDMSIESHKKFVAELNTWIANLKRSQKDLD